MIIYDAISEMTGQKRERSSLERGFWREKLLARSRGKENRAARPQMEIGRGEWGGKEG